MAEGSDIGIDNKHHNDVLCYMQNCFSNHPRGVICNNLAALFDEEEVVVAKAWLFTFVDALGSRPDGLPRRIRRQGENKKKLDCEDLLGLYSALDNAKVKLPLFTAANLKRLMPLATGELDICTLAAMMSDMQSTLSNIVSRLNSLEAHVNDQHDSVLSTFHSTHKEVRQAFGSMNVYLDHIDLRLNERLHPTPAANVETVDMNTAGVSLSSMHSESNSQMMSSAAKLPDDQGHGPPNASSWADMAGGDWIQVSAPRKSTKPSRPTPSVKMTGTRTGSVDNQLIKAVPRKNIVAAFVGRMSMNTKEEDLKSYLETAGIKDVICHKLKPKEGYQFKTSAFFVSCNVVSREMFWDSSNWPEGAELRDWVFRS